jgi:hypothetical protein
MGPVKRANLDHHHPLHPPEDGDRASLRNVVIYKDRTMDIVHKHSSLVHHAPSSESFQAYLVVRTEII